jgi:hypothetical protein
MTRIPLRSAVIAVVLLLAVSFPASARRRAVAHPTPRPIVDSEYLNAARAAAAWLETLERRDGEKLSWPASEGSSAHAADISQGASGIGAFYLRLYAATHERVFLDKALGAGAYVAAANGGGGVDWLIGRTGAGEFFLMLYQATGDPRWLEEARKMAAALVAVSLGDAQTIYWRNGYLFTSLAHGAAGTGLFFLHLHEVTGEAEHLDVAMRAYRWMMGHTLRAESGITFKRTTEDTAGHHGWCGGDVGAAIFLQELARATGDAEVEKAWRATLQGLSDSAHVRGDPGAPEYFWRYGPTSTGGAPVIYCHGGAGAAARFASAFLVTGEPEYRETAVAAARWLDGVAIAEAAGRSWRHIMGSPLHELGLLTGTASVGHASLELYRALREPADLERARAAAAWLLSMAEHPAAGQSKWITRTDTVGGTPRYDTGWYMGAAGIGLFFLELHEAERGDLLPRRFSIANP